MTEFEKILAENMQFVRQVAMGYTANAADADDLTQDVMVAALRFRDKYESNTNFRGWIRTITKNTFINSYRKKSRSKEVLSEDIHRDVVDEEKLDFDVQPVDAPLGEEIIEAVMQLPSKYKSLFLLVYIYGYSYDDVAAMKKMPVGTIKSMLFKSRQMLREVLGQRAKEMGISYKVN